MALVCAALGLVGCGSDDGPASYVGKASNAVIYVSWTQSKGSLSGRLTQARPPDDVQAGKVDVERVGFDGTVDGSAVSLRLNEGLGTTSTLTGKLDGDTLTLDYPGTDGQIITINLHKGDGSDFNTALAALRDRVTRAKEQADQAAADEQARQDAAQLADNVRSGMAALDQGAGNATANGPDLYQADLDTVSSDLDTVKSSYEVVTEAIDNGYDDTICDDAANVGDDVDNMRHDISSMHGDVKRNSDPGALDRDIADLRSAFAQMRALDPTLLPDDAPTKADVDAAISAARRKVRATGGQGANFTRTQQILSQAEAIKAKADAACQARG